MLKSYGNKKGRSKFVSYKPNFHTHMVSYIQESLYILTVKLYDLMDRSPNSSKSGKKME